MALSNRIDPREAQHTLTEWLAARLPDGLGVRVSDVEVPSASGLSCETLVFDASWNQDGKERCESLVARVAPVGGGGLYPSYDLETEARIMGALAEHTDVPAPRVLFTETDPSVLNGPFLVTERIEGRVPSDDPPYTLGGWVLDLSPGEQRRLVDDAVATVAAISRVDWMAIGLDALDRPDCGKAGLHQQLTYLEQIYAHGARGRSHAIPEAGLKSLRANAPEDQPLALSWGDARIGNMLFTGDGSVAGVLDWEVAGLRSPEADISYFLFMIRLMSEGFGAPSPPGFPSREEMLARFEQVSGHTVKHLDYYERLGAVFVALTVMSAGYLMIEHGLLPLDSPMPVTNPASVLLAEYLGLPAPAGKVTDWAGKR